MRVFLEEELDAVGQRLQQPKGPTRDGPQLFWMRPQHLALEQHRVGDRHQG